MKPSGLFHCAYLLDYCEETHTLHRWLEAFSLTPSLLITFRHPLQCWHHQPLLRTPKGHSTIFLWSSQAGNLMLELRGWFGSAEGNLLLCSLNSQGQNLTRYTLCSNTQSCDEKLPYPNSNTWTDLKKRLNAHPNRVQRAGWCQTSG